MLNLTHRNRSSQSGKSKGFQASKIEELNEIQFFRRIQVVEETTKPSTRPYWTSSTQVFTETSDLAAHYGIPQVLPPAPYTTPRRMSSDSLDQTNRAEDQVSLVADTAFTPLSDDAVRTLMDVLQGELANYQCTACASLLTYSASPYSTASPDLAASSTDNFSDFLTSPFSDSPYDELMTPLVGSEGMYPEIYTSPVMDWDDSTFADQPLFNDSGSEDYTSLFPATTKQPVDTASQVINMSKMWSISPSTPATPAAVKSALPEDS